MILRTPVLVMLLLACQSGSHLLGAGENDPYLAEIKSVLSKRCYACHGALKQKAGLRLDTAEQIHRGGTDGPVLNLDHPELSGLLERITHADPEERMPPEAEPLKPQEIAAIRNWIAAGAPIPPDEHGDNDPRDHWAFQRIERPALPAGFEDKSPIDAFLAAKRSEHQLVAQPQESERSLLLRRLYLDLIGLPPTAEQQADARPWEVIVDELLASPQHGERWGRHWMDVWRYSDWYGLGAQLRYSQKHLWHWRDWIVESLNADKGYDRMISEMLAADEIAPADSANLRATGFLARNYYLFNRTTWLDSTIEHTGKAFLGLTMNCAKCHDHKYDPIEQVDYYRFRALFEPHQVRLDPVAGVTDFEKDGLPRVFDSGLETKTFLHVRGDPENPDTSKALTPGVPGFLASFASEIIPVSLPTESWAPGSREYARADRRKEVREQLQSAERELAEARSKLAAAPKNAPAKSELPPPAKEGSIWLQDEFDHENPDKWETLGEGWKFEKGQLLQTIVSRDKAMLRSREPHPRDFELTCRYTTTGGATYKSVTFRFDLSDDDKESNFVYTSAHEAGPKVQIAHTTGGKTEYASDGRVAKPIAVGQTYELKFAVRDQLVNVWVDDEFLIAYQLPRRNPGGKLALSAFDATAAFDSITVRPLPAEIELTAATAGTKKAPASPEDPAVMVTIAEARLRSAGAAQLALEATIAADDAAISRAATAPDLARIAAQKQAEAKQAKAVLDVALLEKGGDAAKLKEAQKALKAAEKALAEAGSAYQPLLASKKALESPVDKEEDSPAIFPETSSGRRTMLAQWITSRDNPLTARVAVNHVWLRHFGEPLVATVFDFGRQASRPENQELLDWLAAEFIESGWSFRHLHRLMVTSETYRLTSTAAGADRATLEADPTNRFYWRMNPRRMEAQVVRDSLLELSGTLDTTMGGPSLSPSKPSNRRSLYFLHSRDQQDKFLTMFDDADLLQCYRRSESIVPQQALALSNSALSLEQAARIADHLAVTDDENEFIAAAFAIILARAPDESERAECRLYLADLRELSPGEKPEATDSRHRAQLIHALLNHNDFVTIR